MKQLISFVVAIGLIMAFTVTTQAQDWSSAQKEVWKVVKTGWENWKTGDTEASLKLIHDKYQGWNTEHPLPSSKAKVGEYYEMMKEYFQVMYYDISPARITVTDNAAVVHYYFTFYAVYGEEKKTEKEITGKNTEFYVKEKGKWLMLGDMTFVEGDDD
jgi:hypothetical protein